MTDEEIMDELGSGSLLDRIRHIFAGEAARIEQAAMQRTPLMPIEARRMEFTAAKRLIAEMEKSDG